MISLYGKQLGFEWAELDTIKEDSSKGRDRVTTVFGHLFDNANNLPNSHLYPKTWDGLIALLDASGLGDIAEKVREALSAPFSNVRHNLH